jgi:hypothetical protein
MVPLVCGVVVVALVVTMVADTVRAPRHAVGMKAFAGHLVFWVVVGYLAIMATLHLHSDVQTVVVIVLGMVSAAVSGRGSSMTAVTALFAMVIAGGLLARLVSASPRTMVWELLSAVLAITFFTVFFALRGENASHR